MDLHCQLPAGMTAQVTARLGPAGTPQFAVASDLTLGRRYGTSYLAVVDGRVVAGDTEALPVCLELRDVKEVKVDELFGGGRLVAETATGEVCLTYYTKALVPEFGAMCRILNDLIHGKATEEPDLSEAAYCRRCGAALPERGDSCPRCVPRREVFRRLMAFVRPYRGRVVLLMAATVVTVGSQMAPPYLTKLIVDSVIRSKDLSRLGWYVGGMVLCGVLLLLSRFVSGMLNSWLASRVIADIREQLHAHLERLQMRYLNRRESGEMVARVMHDTGEVRQFLFEGLPFMLVNSLSFVGIAVVLLYLDATLALLVFLPVPFLIGGGGWFWARLIPLFNKFGVRMSHVHSVLSETIQGIKTIKVCAQERRQSTRFNRAAEGLCDISYRIDRTFVGFFEVMFWFMSLGVAAVWFFAARRIADGDPSLTVGDLLAFVGYIWLFYGPLQWFTVVLNWMTHAFSGAERIFAVLDAPAEVSDEPDAVHLPAVRGAISFHDVRFSYERGKEVIKGVSFDVAPGEMIGLVGKSGAGKSTIINLICRFYDVDSGTIVLDGQPLKKLRLDDLRHHIGIVMQEPFLVNDTILENIRYGAPTASLGQVVRAAQAARAHEFILEKECGYDTYIGEGGATLSGGEKQRVAIARAILHDPAILILDEATSSVDSETEKAIQEAIANLIRNRTTIAIAHRLATLRNATRLVVVEDGKVAEVGTHSELLAREGIYAKLVQIQSELSKLRSEVWQE